MFYRYLGFLHSLPFHQLSAHELNNSSYLILEPRVLFHTKAISSNIQTRLRSPLLQVWGESFIYLVPSRNWHSVNGRECKKTKWWSQKALNSTLKCINVHALFILQFKGKYKEVCEEYILIRRLRISFTQASDSSNSGLYSNDVSGLQE